jgi:predicted transcriptional regulator
MYAVKLQITTVRVIQVSKVTSVRLSEDLITKLDRLAASLDRPRAWLIEQAIAHYVDEEAWHVEAISEALAEYQKGKSALKPHAEVVAQLGEKIRARAASENPLA